MLTNDEMLNVTGGGVSWTLLGLLGTAVTLIAGIIDGYLRPLQCGK